MIIFVKVAFLLGSLTAFILSTEASDLAGQSEAQKSGSNQAQEVEVQVQEPTTQVSAKSGNAVAPSKADNQPPSETAGIVLAEGITHLWTLCDNCAQPESAYYSPLTKNIFLSNVDGEPGAKDSKGSLQKMGASGKLLNAQFVTGLNAPKGIRARNGKLYVADIDRLLIINEKSGKIERTVAFEGAKFLNDIAIDSKGTVYISDTVGSAIYSWSAKKGVKTLASGKFLECPNGLLVDGDSLWIASWGVMEPDWSTKVPGRLLQMNLKSSEIKVVTETPVGNLDGLEKIDSETFLVSDWMAGKVFSISRKGEVKVLISGFKGSADLAWIPERRTMVIPRMGENLVSAYQLK